LCFEAGTGLSQVSTADSFARADASVTGSLGDVRVQITAGAQDSVDAQASIRDTWTSPAAVGAATGVPLGVTPVLNVHGTVGSQGRVGIEYVLEGHIFDIASPAGPVVTTVLLSVQLSRFNNDLQGWICADVCTPLTIPGPTFAQSIPLPTVSIGPVLAKVAPDYAPFGITVGGRMVESTRIRAAGNGPADLVDFFNTVSSGLQAPDRASESVWVSESGRALLPAPSADHTPPTTVATLSPAPNAAGWNNRSVTVALTAQDEPGGSGIKEIHYAVRGAQVGGGTVTGASTSLTISAEGTTTVTYFAVDNAGNQETAKTAMVRIDMTPPTVTFGSPSPAPNAAGWNNTDVSIPFRTADTLSGVAGTSPPSPVALTAEGTAVTATITVVDKAGNAATFTSPAVRIDKAPPTVACVPVTHRRHDDDDDDDGKGLFRVSASDTLSQVATITLGGVSLGQGEVVQIRSTKRPGIRLVRDTDDDDRDDPRFRRFKVGPGEAVIRATDFAGNIGTAVCPLPTRQHDDDDDSHGKRGAHR